MQEIEVKNDSIVIVCKSFLPEFNKDLKLYSYVGSDQVWVETSKTRFTAYFDKVKGQEEEV